MKGLRIAFLLLLAAAAAVLALRIRNGVETDLYGLVDARSGGVLAEIASGLANQGRVLLEGEDFKQIKSVAVQVAQMSRHPPKGDFKDTLRYLDAHKSGLLAPETRERLLAGKYHEVAEDAMARLFSPVPRLLSVKDDPFLLATEYVTALQSGLAGDWTMRDGYPVCEREGKIYLLLTLDLSDVPMPQLANCVDRCSRTEVPFGAGTKVWCGGAPFHSAVATDRSKREIGVLTCASLACVLLLGVLLFRSLRFLPALLLAQGTGFLVAAAALFLFFPKPHVLTFVFGTSLIGLSVDYVYHARMAGGVRRILRPLTLSLLTTVACFAPLLFADVVVLRQMALFSIAGLLASFATVALLPPGKQSKEIGGGGNISGQAGWIGRMLLGILLVSMLAGLFHMTMVDDPTVFYRPNEYLAASERLIAELSPGQAQRFAFVRGKSLQEALEREEAMGVRGLSAVIPSLRRQRENVELISRLVEAEGSNYTAKTGLRMPKATRADFLDPEQLEEGPLLQMVRTMRVARGLISPLPQGTVAPPEVEVLDPRAALQGLFHGFTCATLKLLAVSFGVFVLVLALVFRRRMLHYLLPVFLSLAATAGALGWLGIPLTFFSLLCFFVLAGLGIDYVIFQNSDPSPSTRRVVLFAFLTSFAGFGLLAFTDFPVTRSMGITFSIGLLFAWIAACFVSSQKNSQPQSSSIAWHEQREQSAGHFRMKFMWCVYAWFGKGLQKVLCIPVMAFIFPFAAPAKRALRGFYAKLADFSPRHVHLRSPSSLVLFRHMLGFAWSLADKTDACTLKKNLPKMTVRDDEGWRAFRNLVAAKKGAFFISTHLGTIEVLPALAANQVLNSSTSQHLNLPVPHVHAFQQMGHNSVFTKMFMKHFDGSALTLHPVEEIGVETAVEMQNAIARGELVLMAGDRVSAGSTKTLQHDFLGCSCRWPKGVFAFAKLMESPIFFVTCVRTGWNAYECRFRLFDPRLGNRAAAMLDQYSAFLEAETLEHPDQWYQFYDFFMV